MTGDGIVDAETVTPTVRLEPDAPGMLPVRVAFKDASGISLGAASLQETVLAAIPAGSGGVLSPLPEGAIKIDVVAEGLHVTLQPVFAATSPVTASGQHLSSLAVLWSFGDGTTSYLLTPEHTYAAEGAYDVILTFRDMASGMDIATASTRVTVQPGMAPTPTSSLGLKLFRSVLSFARIVLFSLLVLFLLLGLLLLPVAFLAQRKGVSLREALRNPKKLLEKTTETHAPSAVMPEILAAAPVQTPEVSSSETQPFALQQEESIEEEASTEPPPSSDREEPFPEEAPAETENVAEQENIPPWLQVQAEEEPVNPPPLPSPAPEPIQPTATVVPPWLQKGLMGAAETAPSSPLAEPSAPLASMEDDAPSPPIAKPSLPPAPMPVTPTEDIFQEIPAEKNAEELPVAENKTVDESDVAPISTDEPIAIVRAEVEEEER
jgi:PKD repeat protein